MTTNRITVDIDKSFLKFAISLVRFLLVFRRLPRIKKTRRGWHLWIYLDKLISDKEMIKLRKLLLDDSKRIKLDMVCKFKPKQVLFHEKIVTEVKEGKVKVIQKYSKP